ncbi:MAG: tetratricopeptide repeat protein [Limisphaerales bacterium]
MTLLKTVYISEATYELQRTEGWWLWNHIPFTADFLFLPTTRYWPIAAVKAHYWLGVAYEQTGEKEKAQKEYEKFLEIWKDADFNSPELADAKERLARLKKKG